MTNHLCKGLKLRAIIFLLILFILLNCDNTSTSTETEPEEHINTSLLITTNSFDSTGCDYLIITHEYFTDAALKLADYRRTSELDDVEDPKVVTTRTIDSLINGSIKINISKETIKAFINLTQLEWLKKPKYTVLFSDHSIKPHLYAGIPNPDSAWGADHYYSDLDDSAFYDIILGRVPVSSVEEAEGYVKKIKEFELNRPKNLLTITDDNWNGDYKENIDFKNIKNELFTHLDSLSEFDLDIHEFNFIEFSIDDSTKLTIEQREIANKALIDSFNKENQIITYYGHAAPEMIADNIFTFCDVEKIKTIDFWISLGCHTNYFKSENSFAKALLRNPNGGAVGVIGSYLVNYSGSGQRNINEFYRQLYHNPENHSIGDAFLKIIPAKRRVVPGYTLMYLGDPAIPIK